MAGEQDHGPLLGLHPRNDVSHGVSAKHPANHDDRRDLDVEEQCVEIKGIGEGSNVVAEDQLIANQADAKILVKARADK